MTQSRIGRICLVSFVTAAASEPPVDHGRWNGSYVPCSGHLWPRVWAQEVSPLIASNWPAQNCNAHQQRGRKQKSTLSASAAKFGSCVLLFQLLGMKWLSERVTNPGLAGLCAAWRRCLKWHFNPERCADMSYQHKKGPFVAIVLHCKYFIVLGRTNCQHSLACHKTFFKVSVSVKHSLLVVKTSAWECHAYYTLNIILLYYIYILYIVFESPNSFSCDLVSKFHKRKSASKLIQDKHKMLLRHSLTVTDKSETQNHNKYSSKVVTNVRQIPLRLIVTLIKK